MHQKYLSMLRDELTMSKLSVLPCSVVDEFHRLYSDHLEKIIGHPRAAEMFLEHLYNYMGDAERLIRVRLTKNALGAPCSEESIDHPICVAVQRMIRFYTEYMTAQYVSSDGKILVRALETVYARRRVYRKGAVFATSVEEALFLYIAGFVEPVPSIIATRLREILGYSGDNKVNKSYNS